jgi:hypothetical protein
LRQELINAEQVDPTVAGDRLGQGHFVGGFDELVDEFGGQGVLDSEASHCCFGAQSD